MGGEVIVDIAQGFAIIICAIIIAVDRRKERKARKIGLPPNPARCEEHALRLTAIETDIKWIKQRLEKNA